MNIVVSDTYQQLSKRVADDLIKAMQSFEQPLLCPPSGDTPQGLYKELINRYNEQKLDINSWSFVSLDEWVGMNEENEGSARQSLNEQLFKPLNVAEEQICFFNGKALNLEDECTRIENFIRRKGGVDVSVLGLGMNGHIGLNEPGTSPDLHVHVVDVASETQKVGQKYFKQQQQLTQGITLGIATLLQSKHIILIVSGKHKAKIVKQVLESDVSTQIPATYLKDHPDCTLYLDEEAAEMIKNTA
jgi:galactosamine-6-phosphate isomerase